jgi:DNA-directed RNA polymerase subunit A"
MKEIAAQEILKYEAQKLAKKLDLSESKKNELEKLMIKDYLARLVNYAEPVGQIAAQSMGERGTQMNLRTKHYAGAKEVSVGSGIQRVKEIVDGRKKIKYPSMTIYLKGDLAKDEKLAKKFANSLVEIKMSDIAVFYENFEDKKVSIDFNLKEIKDRGLDLEELADLVEKKAKGKARRDIASGKIRLAYGEEDALLKIRKDIIKLKNLKLQGIKNIEGALVSQQGNEFVITTRGTNLKAILKLQEVDETRTYTNDIFEIFEEFGIEAARGSIIRELSKIYGQEVDVDIRHVILMADTMTFSGEVKGIVRTGLNKLKSSPLARAAFEETIKHLMDAAFKNEEEKIAGVTENIIVGQPIKVGTGKIKLVMKK